MLRSLRQFVGKITGLNNIFNPIYAQLNILNDRQTEISSSLTEVKQWLDKQYHLVQTLRVDNKTVITKIFTDLKMYLNPSDMAVAAHIALDGVWEKEITRAWLTVLKPDYTVLDIGANFGYFGLLSGQFTDRNKARIVLFEANKHIVPYVNRSISINWFNEHVKVENLAVSDENGEVTLTVLKDYTGSSSVQSFDHLKEYMNNRMQLEVSEKLKVQAVSIDEYCANHSIKDVNLIKMDIEGYEEQAYKGMRAIINKSKDITLFIEFTKDGYNEPKQFYNTMLHDFGNVFIIDKTGAIVAPADSSYEGVIESSYGWTMPIFSKNSKLDRMKNTIIG